MTVDLFRTYALFHCNRLWFVWIQKVRIEKKFTNLLQCLEFFLNYKIGIKGGKAQFIGELMSFITLIDFWLG